MSLLGAWPGIHMCDRCVTLSQEHSLPPTGAWVQPCMLAKSGTALQHWLVCGARVCAPRTYLGAAAGNAAEQSSRNSVTHHTKMVLVCRLMRLPLSLVRVTTPCVICQHRAAAAVKRHVQVDHGAMVVMASRPRHAVEQGTSTSSGPRCSPRLKTTSTGGTAVPTKPTSPAA